MVGAASMISQFRAPAVRLLFGLCFRRLGRQDEDPILALSRGLPLWCTTSPGRPRAAGLATDDCERGSAGVSVSVRAEVGREVKRSSYWALPLLAPHVEGTQKP